MQSKTATLQFSSQKHCFIKLPKLWSDKLHTDQIYVFKIESTTGSLYATWSGEISVSSFNATSSDTIVEICGLFASKQALKNGQVVSVSLVNNVTACEMVFVEPATVDDWEILEMNSSFIEANLLNQLRVVSPGQIFPIWVQKTVCVFVKTGQLEPAQDICLLQAQTQVCVAPKNRSSAPVAASHSMVNDSSQRLSKTSPPSDEDLITAETDHLSDIDIDENVETLSKLQKSDSESTRLGKVMSFIRSVWFGDEEPSDASEVLPHQKPVKYKPELWPVESEFACRVLSLETFSRLPECGNGGVEVRYPLPVLQSELVQADEVDNPNRQFCRHSTDVVLGIFTILSLHPSCSVDSIPSTFLATLTRVGSPSERLASRRRKHSEKKEVVNSLSDEENEDGDEDCSAKCTVRVFVVGLNNPRSRSARFCCPPRGHVLLSDLLRRRLNLPIASRVLLEPLQNESRFRPAELVAQPLFAMPEGFTKEMLRQALTVWFDQSTDVQHPLVVGQGTVLRCFIKQDLKSEFLLSFGVDRSSKSASKRYCLINPSVLRNVSLRIQERSSDETNDKIAVADITQVDRPLPGVKLEQLIVNQDLVKTAQQHIEVCLGQRLLTNHMTNGLRAGALLLCGVRGTGKTSIANALCHWATGDPNNAFVQSIDCKMLRGKKPESIAATIQSALDEAAWHQPSVLILDDLDQIAAACSGPDQEMSGESLYHSRVAQALRQIFKNEIANGSKIAVIATCAGHSSLHKMLASGRGQHFFTKVLEIKPPNHDERKQMLAKFLSENVSVRNFSSGSLNLSATAAKTEGFVARDLVSLVNKTVHSCIVTSRLKPAESVGPASPVAAVADIDFTSVLESFTPSTLRNVPLLKPSDLTWADVGGLHDVRATLQQTLLWPSKYPKLFGSCPLRLRSGLLLYGAPGTGKTLLAGVIAKEYALNFICVKGPELLNKYIGASESAVRDTFVRAQSARPCILFFDEFDSLAPRRGHDSTGVTDRVVNQLLTQLDGIETLEGVYVLAATSRPDLIDPALLRPGRLDKALHCPLPSEVDRLEILTALSRHMTFASDVNLREIASMCEHFTGADFKALLYNSQLSAMNDSDSASCAISSSQLGGINDTVPDAATLSQPSVINDGDSVPCAVTPPHSAVNTSQTLSRAFDVNSTVQLVVVKDADTAARKSRSDITYIPNIARGPVEIDEDHYKQLSQQIAACVNSPSAASAADVRDDTKSAAIVVAQRHLLSSASNMRPSVSPVERLKYLHIYESFVESRGGNFSDSMQSIGKRVTLA